MLTFWIIVAGLTLLALAFVVLPLMWKSSSDTEVDRNELNIAIYKERLAELEPENLAPQQLAQAKQELQKTLAQDLDNNAASTQQSRARWASVVVAIAVPILAIGGYWQLGGWHLLIATPSAEMEAPQVPDMVAKLAKRLESNPDDLEGWRMLARSYQTLGNSTKATQTYKKILARFRENQEALFFLGVAAMKKEDYKAAVDYWQRLLKQIPPDDVKVRAILEKRIAEARQFVQGAEALNSGKTK